MSLLTEPRLSLSSLARREGVHTATAWRWVTRGVRGQRLESLVIGGKRFTTEAAFSRWVAALNDSTANVNCCRRATNVEQTKQILVAAGLISPLVHGVQQLPSLPGHTSTRPGITTNQVSHLGDTQRV